MIWAREMYALFAIKDINIVIGMTAYNQDQDNAYCKSYSAFSVSVLWSVEKQCTSATLQTSCSMILSLINIMSWTLWTTMLVGGRKLFNDWTSPVLLCPLLVKWHSLHAQWVPAVWHICQFVMPPSGQRAWFWNLARRCCAICTVHCTVCKLQSAIVTPSVRAVTVTALQPPTFDRSANGVRFPKLDSKSTAIER